MVDSKVVHNHSPQPDVLTAKDIKISKTPTTDIASKHLVAKHSSPACSSRRLTSSTPAQPSKENSVNSSRVEELEAQNRSLLQQVSELTRNLDVMTNHAIESDSRLVQYTDQIVASSRSIVNTTSEDNISLNSDDYNTLNQKVILLEHQLNEKEVKILHLQNKLNAIEGINILPKVLVSVGCQTIQEKHEKKITTLNLQMYDRLKNLEDEVYEKEVLITDLLKYVDDESKNREIVGECRYSRVSRADRHTSNSNSKFRATSFELPLHNKFQALTNFKNGQDEHSNVYVDHTHSANSSAQPVAVVTQSQPTELSSGRRIMILADSHGRNLYQHLQGENPGFSVSVLAKSGAKLKHILREGRSMVKHFSPADFIVVLGGTNDFGKYEPSQLTLHQGINELLSWGVDTNIVVLGIPYRHDEFAFNNKIFFANNNLQAKIQAYNGKSNISFLDLNALMHRHHYTAHGMHFNKHGKKYMARLIFDQVRCLSNTVSERCQPPSSPAGSRYPSPVHQRSHMWCSSIQHSPAEKRLPPLHSSPAATLSFTYQPPDVSVDYQPHNKTVFLSQHDFPPLPPSPHTKRASADVQVQPGLKCFLGVESTRGKVN